MVIVRRRGVTGAAGVEFGKAAPAQLSNLRQELVNLRCGQWASFEERDAVPADLEGRRESQTPRVGGQLPCQIAKNKARSACLRLGLEDGAGFVKTREMASEVIEVAAQVIWTVIFHDRFQHQTEVQQVFGQRVFLGRIK